MKSTWLTVLLLFCFFLTAHGQRPPFNSVGGRGGGPSSIPQSNDYFTRDTSDVIFFYADKPSEEYVFIDTILGKYVVQYDPIRQRRWDYVHLGHLGSAHQQVVFSPLQRKGFDLGFHQYDLYQTKAEDLPFYRITRPFTNLAYSQVAEQSNGYVEAQFSRNFADGINLSIDYKRINQLGTQTKYLRQDVQNTALAFGLWFEGPSKKYTGMISFASNTIRQEDNGGIGNAPQEVTGFRSPTSASIFLTEAETRHALREVMYTHYFTLGGGQDSTQRVKRSYSVGHQLNYASNKYKFFDVSNQLDPLVYKSLLGDPRGFRHALRYNKLSNSFRLKSFKLAPGKSNKDVRSQRDLLEVGLTHSLYNVDQEATDSTINTLFLNGTLNLALKDRIQLNAEAHLGLLDQGGDYRISGELLINLRGIGSLQFRATNQLTTPTLLQTRFYVNQQALWNNDFSKTLSTSLEASYQQPKLGLRLTGRYHLLNNYIYHDTIGIARQTGRPISVLQLIVEEDIQLGAFHLDNTLIFQSSSEEEIRVPGLFSKHSLYYQSNWFRFLNIRIGADARFQTTYRGNYYHPLFGQFILQDRQEVPFYPAIDAYVAFRVTKFKAFFKVENVTQSFTPDELFYLNAFYPHSIASGFRVGFQWRFWD
jgi:hypothetical protein